MSPKPIPEWLICRVSWLGLIARVVPPLRSFCVALYTGSSGRSREPCGLQTSRPSIQHNQKERNSDVTLRFRDEYWVKLFGMADTDKELL